MVPEAAGIGRVGYLIANSAAVDAVGGALITVLLGWAVQLFASRKRIAWRAYLDTRINLTPAQAARLRFRVYVDEPGSPLPSEVSLPWMALLRVRNAGFVPIRGTDFNTPLTFVFPGRQVRGAEVIDHAGAELPALAEPAHDHRGQQAQRARAQRPAPVSVRGGLARLVLGLFTPARAHPVTAPDVREPTDRVQLSEGLLLNPRDRFTLMVVLSGAATETGRRIRQTGSLIGGRIVAEPPRRGPNTRSMLFGGSVALPLAGLLLGLLVSLNPPPGPQCAAGSLTLEGSTAFAPAAQQIASQYMATCHVAHITVVPDGSVMGLNWLVTEGARNPGGSVAMSDGPKPTGAHYSPLVPNPIGVIIFTVVVNSDTGKTTLTTAQVQGIFTGAYTNWDQLGGPDLKIKMVSRLPVSGSREAFDNFVLGPGITEPQPSSFDCVDKDERPDSPVYLCQEPSTQALLQAVATTPGAIGYSESSDAANYNGRGAEAVRLNELPGAFGYIGTGPEDYPFWAVEYLYTYGSPPQSSLASKFVGYVLSSSTVLRADGYTPCAGLLHTLCSPHAHPPPA